VLQLICVIFIMFFVMFCLSGGLKRTEKIIRCSKGKTEMVFSSIHLLNHAAFVYILKLLECLRRNSLMVLGICTRKLKVCHAIGEFRYRVSGVVMKVVE